MAVDDFDFEQPGSLKQPILDYLNAGGSSEGLRAGMDQAGWARAAQDLVAVDLTGDGIAEILVDLDSLYIFSCQNGSYVSIYEKVGVITPHFLPPRDMNGNQVPDLIEYFSEPGPIEMKYFWIKEWDGRQFADLITQADFQSPNGAGGVNGGSIWFKHVASDRSQLVQDTDGDGLLELALYGGVASEYSGVYIDFCPCRPETHTYRWNGQGFVLDSLVIDPPTFRFQALQDGDAAALTGQFDRALALYQDVIFSDRLEWYSRERWLNEHLLDLHGIGNDGPTATPVSPDPREYYYLAAYARFRIMLLHLRQGTEADAQVVYQTLQEKFPVGQPGAEFAAMAELFWTEYQISHSIAAGCAQAINFISPDEAALAYLGDGQHGDSQDYVYGPEKVCPF